jgi:hypothetical protein
MSLITVLIEMIEEALEDGQGRRRAPRPTQAPTRPQPRPPQPPAAQRPQVVLRDGQVQVADRAPARPSASAVEESAPLPRPRRPKTSAEPKVAATRSEAEVLSRLLHQNKTRQRAFLLAELLAPPVALRGRRRVI